MVDLERNRALRKRLGKAQQVILEGEEIIDGATGLIHVRRMGQNTARSGVVIATDRRVILFTTKLGGYDVQDFAYGLLTSVDHKKGVMFGDLHLNAAGDASHVKQIPNRTLLLASVEERQLVEVDGLLTGAAAAGPATQDGLQE